MHFETKWHVKVRAIPKFKTSELQNFRTSQDDPWMGRGRIDRNAIPAVVSRRSRDYERGRANRSVTVMEATRVSPFYLPHTKKYMHTNSVNKTSWKLRPSQCKPSRF